MNLQKTRFEELLKRYNNAKNEAAREQVRQTVFNEFSVTCAVFVLDTSGFSNLTKRYGPVHLLAMNYRMRTR